MKFTSRIPITRRLWARRLSGDRSAPDLGGLWPSPTSFYQRAQENVISSDDGMVGGHASARASFRRVGDGQYSDTRLPLLRQVVQLSTSKRARVLGLADCLGTIPM